MQCILPPSFDDHLDDLAAYQDELAAAALDAFESDAAQSTRDDGLLFHGRLPCEDTDAFNPCIITHERTPILPPRGGDPIGTGLPVCGVSL